MSHSLAKIKTGQSQKRHLKLKKWERTRAQGQARFVIHNTMLVALFTMLLYDAFGGGAGLDVALRAHLIGLVTAWNGWRVMEKRYQKALLEAPLNTTAAPTNVLGLRGS